MHAGPPKIITDPPNSECVQIESLVTLTVSVTGTGSHISYQWMKDGSCITRLPNCTGADTASLHISSFSLVHEGNYKCMVSVDGDEVESDSTNIKCAVYIYGNIVCGIIFAVLYYAYRDRLTNHWTTEDPE